jgi:formate dehydrogenase major subunit
VTFLDMLDGKVKGYFLLGQNPAVGSANSKLHRLALAQLDWLVVRDLQEIESASFWKDGPELETGELRTDKIPTEMFLMPAASHVEKDGSFTNTDRPTSRSTRARSTARPTRPRRRTRSTATTRS